MNEFPEFMRHPYNRVFAKMVSGPGVQGYMFDGADGSQMIIWTCETDGASAEHTHTFDEYLLVVQGQYTVILAGEKILVAAGQEYVIPQGQAHAGEYIAGTRIIQAYGGRRAKRAIEERS